MSSSSSNATPAAGTPPALLYLAVAKGNTLLAAHANGTQNAAQIASLILEKLDQTTDGKQTFLHKQYAIHVLHTATPFGGAGRAIQGGVTYLAMATESLGRRIPFACLLETKRRFLETYSQAEVALAGSFELKAFQAVLSQIAHDMAGDGAAGLGSANLAREVQSELDAVKQVMTQNIERVLERGERIDLLVDKTALLNSSSVAFRKKSVAVKRQMWWQNVKTTALIGVVMLVLVYLLVGTGCGLPGWQRCF